MYKYVDCGITNSRFNKNTGSDQSITGYDYTSTFVFLLATSLAHAYLLSLNTITNHFIWANVYIHSQNTNTSFPVQQLLPQQFLRFNSYISLYLKKKTHTLRYCPDSDEHLATRDLDFHSDINYLMPTLTVINRLYGRNTIPVGLFWSLCIVSYDQ